MKQLVKIEGLTTELQFQLADITIIAVNETSPLRNPTAYLTIGKEIWQNKTYLGAAFEELAQQHIAKGAGNFEKITFYAALGKLDELQVKRGVREKSFTLLPVDVMIVPESGQ